jgi:hypothetical protein
MNDPQYVPPYYPQQPQKTVAPIVYRRSTAWTPILIFACLALGFTASAVEYERARVVGERDRANILAADDSVVAGRIEDLGKFLADSQTRWIRLTNPQNTIGIHAVVAWNAQSQSGYLFCDQLTPLDGGNNYELWTLHGSDDPQSVGAVAPEAGASVYPFRLKGEGMVIGNRLEITAGPRSESKTPILSGAID